MEFEKQLMNWGQEKRLSRMSERSGVSSIHSFDTSNSVVLDEVARREINVSENDDEKLIVRDNIAAEETTEWKPSRKEWLIIGTLSTLSLMTALDATILVSVLPVSVGISGLDEHQN
jgi:hypothetical protein